jgi:type I restriction enzyme S subunit
MISVVTDSDRALPKGWKQVRLGDVSKINPSRPKIDRADETPTTFVPMEAVDAQTGTISASRLRPYGEIKKGYTCFSEGDVLFAKITPCMQNGKHAVAVGLVDDIGFGTTEFHVIRPGPDITPQWIHSFLRQPSFLQKATEHFTGAVGQQRLPPDYLKALEIPLPPLPEQKRIAAILNEQMAAVERARKAAEEELATINVLPAVLLRRAFAGEV